MGTYLVKRPTLLVAAAFASVALCAAAPASADAGLPGTCDDRLSQPFWPWLDPANYVLAPDGGFESGAAGWSLQGGARVAEGNEPWHVGSDDDSHSLSLPEGGQATSPELCLSLAHPTVRFFLRGAGLLLVEVEIDAWPVRRFVPLGIVSGGPGFSPSLPLPLLANLTSPSARLRFTAIDGDFAIDDVYVDPFKVP